MMPRSMTRLVMLSLAGELLTTAIAWRHNRAATSFAVALRWAPGLIAARALFAEAT